MLLCTINIVFKSGAVYKKDVIINKEDIINMSEDITVEEVVDVILKDLKDITSSWHDDLCIAFKENVNGMLKADNMTIRVSDVSCIDFSYIISRNLFIEQLTDIIARHDTLM